MAPIPSPPITTTTNQPTMINMQAAELRPIASHAILAVSALMPFTHGSGHDSHGHAVPNSQAVVRRGLMELAKAGRLAEDALEDSDAMASLPDAAAGDPE